jgi:hypothetical protein
MIRVSLSIEEANNMIKLEGSGDSYGSTTKLEREFTRKFLAHVNKFNTTFKKVHRGNHIRMKVVKR